jgi:predicted urease superfamily metal-dependent hydrolase
MMTKRSFEELMDEYLNGINIISQIDYGNRSSVKKCNRVVDKMINISKCINEDYLSRIYEFAELLTRHDLRIDVWVAHHILENMDYPSDLDNKAVEVIIKYSKEDSVEGLGERIGLEQWYKRNR